MSALAGDPAHIEAVTDAFIAQGLEIVKRLGGWDNVIAQSNQNFERQEQEHIRATAPRPLN
jgi:hypothetical protein